MVTPVQQPDSGLNPLVKLSPVVDVLSKGIAGIAIALYGCGFLIISLHHSQYGFSETNPFRPRILAAGAWFFLFTAIPIAVALRYRTEPWSTIARNAYFLWVGLFSLS